MAVGKMSRGLAAVAAAAKGPRLLTNRKLTAPIPLGRSAELAEYSRRPGMWGHRKAKLHALDGQPKAVFSTTNRDVLPPGGGGAGTSISSGRAVIENGGILFRRTLCLLAFDILPSDDSTELYLPYSITPQADSWKPGIRADIKFGIPLSVVYFPQSSVPITQGFEYLFLFIENHVVQIPVLVIPEGYPFESGAPQFFFFSPPSFDGRCRSSSTVTVIHTNITSELLLSTSQYFLGDDAATASPRSVA
ncbi:hypothetical protein L249_4458 [Ophiocordyceps polyrhachis-furcata BCC 54312]|uniref:Uncharacterized protein n=1 Tax=Ophiocordyceps polyrhachis-furcata BCC 54312 TaxID=1330021 RepID=A0A367L7T5_9HYPO|nr:hypothetical protein L249_4458 [Ophiocordyceps polyrhachis-furcata BCC 54312]